MKNFYYFYYLLWIITSLLINSCAMVTIDSIESKDYITMKRNDVLTSGVLSQITQEEIKKSSQEVSACKKELISCIQHLENSSMLVTDRKLSALSELWLNQAIQLKNNPKKQQERIFSFFESIKYAYAYLFSKEFYSKNRSFEDRYTQIKDYYTYAVQTVVYELYQNPLLKEKIIHSSEIKIGPWNVKIKQDFPDKKITKLIPSSSLKFKGFMGIYRKEGFGAEFIGLTSHNEKQTNKIFSQIETPPLTVIFKFSGNTTQEIINSKKIQLILLDPFQRDTIKIKNKTIPLASNFTAGYGYWLAHSDFAKQPFKTLLGTTDGINKPHIYLMQPYDPNRRIILMIHGLASSPEAWVNLINELIADENIRKNYQIWSVYYPTNMPILLNLISIKKVFQDTISYYDTKHTNKASKNAIIIGHSMGGIIARLMVSNSDKELVNILLKHYQLDSKKITPKLKQELYLKALPEFERAIFLAVPHKGTNIAGQRIGRLASKIVSIPINIIINTGNVFAEILNSMKVIKTDLNNQPKIVKPIPNSIDNLNKNDPFIQITSLFSIDSKVTYHSIIANRFSSEDKIPLKESNDGLVPYWSAHLDGAQSEKVIHSWHSVQEKPEAIAEILRILYLDMKLLHELK